jgi:hypothetical protein
MIRRLFSPIWLAVLVVAACSSGNISPTPSSAGSTAAGVMAETFESQKAFTQTMVAAMAGGDFATVETHFTAEMQAGFPESDLRAS